MARAANIAELKDYERSRAREGLIAVFAGILLLAMLAFGILATITIARQSNTIERLTTALECHERDGRAFDQALLEALGSTTPGTPERSAIIDKARRILHDHACQ